MILYMYVDPEQGQTAPGGRSFDVNRNVLSVHSFVANLKQISLKSDFIQFFNDLIHLYCPRAGTDSPRGQNFDFNRKTLSLYPFVASFKEISSKSDFIHFFLDFIHVYSSEAGTDSPKGKKVLMSTEMSCHFINLLQVS